MQNLGLDGANNLKEKEEQLQIKIIAKPLRTVLICGGQSTKMIPGINVNAPNYGITLAKRFESMLFNKSTLI